MRLLLLGRRLLWYLQGYMWRWLLGLLIVPASIMGCISLQAFFLSYEPEPPPKALYNLPILIMNAYSTVISTAVLTVLSFSLSSCAAFMEGYNRELNRISMSYRGSPSCAGSYTPKYVTYSAPQQNCYNSSNYSGNGFNSYASASSANVSMYGLPSSYTSSPVQNYNSGYIPYVPSYTPSARALEARQKTQDLIQKQYHDKMMSSIPNY